MKDAAQAAIQAKIDEAEALLESIEETANTCISNATTWSAQITAIAVPDPMAPKAAAASLVSLKNAVSMAKANLSVASSQLLSLTAICGGFGLPLPAPVTAAAALINSASSALSIIPI